MGTPCEDPSPALQAAGPSLCQNGTPGSTPGCTARPPSFHASAGLEAEGAHPSARPGATPGKQALLNHASRSFQQGVYTVQSEGSTHANIHTPVTRGASFAPKEERAGDTDQNVVRPTPTGVTWTHHTGLVGSIYNCKQRRMCRYFCTHRVPNFGLSSFYPRK